MRLITGLLSLAALSLGLHAQTKNDQRYVPMCVGFYNLENLYDTIDQPDNDDAEFLPTAPKRWNSERYHLKMEHMARVLGEVATDVHPDGLACVGVSEVENANVLNDLVKTGKLGERGFKYIHHDGPDRRGVDVAFLYNPKYFTPLHDRTYRLWDPADTTWRTRDALVVTGILDGDTMSFIVNHWPSRRGGEKRSQVKRFLAAKLGRHIEDSLLATHPNARTCYMGDLNDDPVDPSIKEFLRTTGDKSKAADGLLFNPMEDLYKKGIGTLAWNDAWNLFDQIIISPALCQPPSSHYSFYGVRVYNEPYLRQSDGSFKGYGFRTYVGDQFLGGYSDHFAVFVILVKAAS